MKFLNSESSGHIKFCIYKDIFRWIQKTEHKQISNFLLWLSNDGDIFLVSFTKQKIQNKEKIMLIGLA